MGISWSCKCLEVRIDWLFFNLIKPSFYFLSTMSKIVVPIHFEDSNHILPNYIGQNIRFAQIYGPLIFYLPTAPWSFFSPYPCRLSNSPNSIYPSFIFRGVTIDGLGCLFVHAQPFKANVCITLICSIPMVMIFILKSFIHIHFMFLFVHYGPRSHIDLYIFVTHPSTLVWIYWKAHYNLCHVTCVGSTLCPLADVVLIFFSLAKIPTCSKTW